jgi:hypothetical protein
LTNLELLQPVHPLFGGPCGQVVLSRLGAEKEAENAFFTRKREVGAVFNVLQNKNSVHKI